MSYTEEVFENEGGYFGGRTGKSYKKSQTEMRGGERWLKPGETPCAVGELVAEVEYNSPAKLKY